MHCNNLIEGTGKSYVGIVILRSLLMVRSAWQKVSPTIGSPPILVLSYKNHAIDEFLVDLIKAVPQVRMVRMGGSAKEPRLARYSEVRKAKPLKI